MYICNLAPRKQKIDTTNPQTLNDMVGTLSPMFIPLQGRNCLVPLILQLRPCQRSLHFDASWTKGSTAPDVLHMGHAS